MNHPYRQKAELPKEDEIRTLPSMWELVGAITTLVIAARFGWWIGDCLRAWGLFP